MKVGDLVRFKRVHPFKKLGIVVGTPWPPRDASTRPAYNIMWNGKYGTFWTQIQHLELLNESR
jgi:hypothetical protein